VNATARDPRLVRKALDARLAAVGIQKKAKVHEALGPLNFIPRCGDPECKMCNPPPTRWRPRRG
jgi:hypothetical protein